MFLIALLLILQVYCETIVEQFSELYSYNPCFSAPDSLNCTLLMCTHHNIATEECQNFSSSARSEIHKLADGDQLRVPQEHSIPPYALGVACFALGFRVPSEQGCASCLFCEQQLNPDVCSFFCKPIQTSIESLPSAIIHSVPLLRETLQVTSQPNKQKTILELYVVFAILITLGLILGVAFTIGGVVLYRSYVPGIANFA